MPPHDKDDVTPPDEPDYWYVTDADGLKFFVDDVRISYAEWLRRAPSDKREMLERGWAKHPNVKEAPSSEFIANK